MFLGAALLGIVIPTQGADYTISSNVKYTHTVGHSAINGYTRKSYAIVVPAGYTAHLQVMYDYGGSHYAGYHEDKSRNSFVIKVNGSAPGWSRIENGKHYVEKDLKSDSTVNVSGTTAAYFHREVHRNLVNGYWRVTYEDIYYTDYYAYWEYDISVTYTKNSTQPTPTPQPATGNYTLTCNPNQGKLQGSSFSDANGTTQSKNLTVTLNKSTYSSLGTATRTGYSYKGWYTKTSGGEQVFGSKGRAVAGNYWSSAKVWQYKGNLTIYAQWTALRYSVTFGKNSGTGGSASTTATYGSAMPSISVPSRYKWNFAGYWDTIKSGGKQYYTASGSSVRSWDKACATTLWAKWTKKVTFGKNGGTGGDDYVTVVPNQPMPTCAIPKRTGWDFNGYWDTVKAGGKQYYSESGRSLRNFDNNGATTLWAKWSSTIKFGKNGGTGGTDRLTVVSGQVVSKISVPTRDGYTFAGYWNTVSPNGTQYFNSSGMPVHAINLTSGSTLWARWISTTTTSVFLASNGGSGGTFHINVRRGGDMPSITIPTRSGHRFLGYWVFSSPTPGFPDVQYYDSNGKPTRYWNRSETTFILYARWD